MKTSTKIDTFRTQFYHLRQEMVIGKMIPYAGTYGTPFALGSSNYTLYDLFCFNGKFAEKLRRINPELSHCLTPEDDTESDRVYLCVRLLYGAEPVQSSDQEVITALIARCHAEALGKVLFLSTHFDIYYEDVLLPKLWLQLVVPRIEFVRHIQYISGEVLDLEVEVDDGCLYLRVSPDTDYQKDLDELKLQTLRYLSSLYVSGVIALPADSPVISRWRLRLIAPGLYLAPWTNYHFARNKSDFLLRLALGAKTITLHVPRESQEDVTRALRLEHFFLEDQVVVIVEGLNQALRVTRSVMKALG